MDASQGHCYDISESHYDSRNLLFVSDLYMLFD